MADDRPKDLTPWWDEDDADASAIALVALVDWIRDRDSLRLTKLRLWDDLYTGAALYDPGNADALDLLADEGIDRGRLNLIRSAVRSIHSKVCTTLPGVVAKGNGADWSQKIRARRLTMFVEGTLDNCNADVLLSQAFMLGLRSGAACAKVAIVDGVPSIEPVSVSELFVDPDDARHGRPRCLYQVRAVSRASLRQQYSDRPDILGAIDSAPAARDDVGWSGDGRWSSYASDSDAVDVYEGWCLPVGDTPGRHLLCLTGGTSIDDEDWEEPRFPIAVVMPSDPAPGRGFWGTGLVEEMEPDQFQVDELVRQIEDHIAYARMKVFVPIGSDIPDEHIQEPSIGTIIPFDNRGGGPPVFHTPDPVSRQVIDYLQMRIDQFYTTNGISEQAAAGMRSPGVNSGRAMLVEQDFRTLRHIDLVKRWQRFAVEVVARLIDACRRMSEDDPGWTARWSKGSVVRSVAWDRVDMDRDAYSIELKPTSAVPTSYAGQMQQVEDMLARGEVPPAYAESLVSDPDLWRARRLACADADFVDDVVWRLIDPEEEMPLFLDAQDPELTFDVCRAELLNAVREGATPEVIGRFDEYMAQVTDRVVPPTPQQTAQQPAQPAPMPLAAPLGAVPSA